MTPDYLPRFYDTLIRTTLKSSFEEFKGRVEELEGVRVEEYFAVRHLVRERVVGRSLYQLGEMPIGCSIRNTLTLVRKAMEK
jgi:hypothetical protein